MCVLYSGNQSIWTAFLLSAIGVQGILPAQYCLAADNAKVSERKEENKSKLQVKNVNSRSILSAIQMGCQTMQNVFNADDRQVPFFGAYLYPPPARFQFNNCHCESHVPGRHLNALLNAEDAVGIELAPSAVENHRKAAFFSYSGAVPLPLNRETLDGPLVNFSPHNLREGFHALYALAKYRDDAEAREIAQRSIATIMELWSPKERWDIKRIESLGLTYFETQDFIHGEARMIGPLVKYYKVTGYGPALELALLLKEKAVNEYFLEDGDYSVERFKSTHSHSITCVMSSLAQLADLTNDAALMERVRRFYDTGLWKLRDEIGWSPESTQQRNSDHGEVNNSGDILETALILGRWGYPKYYHDAERILRCHILPSQLRDVSFTKDDPERQNIDAYRNAAQRHLGAFGFPAPYGHKSIGAGRGEMLCFNMDIVGGTVGSLVEAYREVARFEETGHWVNLLFDHETDAIQVKSPYTNGCLEITLKKSAPLFVRIPPWVDKEQLQIEGSDAKPCWYKGYLFFAKPPLKKTIAIRFPLKEQTITLSGKLHIHPIKVKLRGDEVVAMESFGADFIFFKTYEPLTTESLNGE